MLLSDENIWGGGGRNILGQTNIYQAVVTYVR